MEENKYQEAYYKLKSSLKGEKYLGQEVAKLDLGDTLLIKSQTEDGKLCWIVENKFEEYMKNDIELIHKLVEEMKEYEIITLDDYDCVNIDLKNQRFVVRLNNGIQYPIIKQKVNGKIKYFIDMEGKNVPLDKKVTETVKSEINSYMRSGI